MAINEDFAAYVNDQLSEVGGVESKKMFGGIGYFKEGKMFGMISTGDVFRLKVDDSNKADYKAAGMEPLFMKNKKKGMPYWQVPAEVLEDKKNLAEWAVRSVQIARNSK